MSKMDTNYLTNVTDKKGNTLEIEMRPDGYFNASKMCKSTKRLWADYRRNNRTQEFLEELAEATNLSVSAPENSLVYTKNGGLAPGTWVHRKVRRFWPAGEIPYCSGTASRATCTGRRNPILLENRVRADIVTLTHTGFS